MLSKKTRSSVALLANRYLEPIHAAILNAAALSVETKSRRPPRLLGASDEAVWDLYPDHHGERAP